MTSARHLDPKYIGRTPSRPTAFSQLWCGPAATLRPWRQRFAGLLMGVFAGTALILAALGMYGVISYWASLRVHETGVRMALGASRSDILGSVIGKGLKLVAVGVCLGAAAALALSRFVSGLLYGVSPYDPWALGFVSILLLGLGLLASYIPARRSMNIDPVAALRCG